MRTDPVDLATGTMYLPQTDVALPGTLPLVFDARLRLRLPRRPLVRSRLVLTVDQRLEIDAEGVVFSCDEDGLLLPTRTRRPVSPSARHGPRWPLDRVAGGYTITDPETGRIRHFVRPPSGDARAPGADRRPQRQLDHLRVRRRRRPDVGIVHSGGYHLKLTTRRRQDHRPAPGRRRPGRHATRRSSATATPTATSPKSPTPPGCRCASPTTTGPHHLLDGHQRQPLRLRLRRPGPLHRRGRHNGHMSPLRLDDDDATRTPACA